MMKKVLFVLATTSLLSDRNPDKFNILVRDSIHTFDQHQTHQLLGFFFAQIAEPLVFYFDSDHTHDITLR